MKHMRLQLREQQHHLVVDLRADGRQYHVTLDGKQHIVEAHRLDPSTLLLTIDGKRHRVAIACRGQERLVSIAGEFYSFAKDTDATAHRVESVASPEIVAPMPGKILQVFVQPGDQVTDGTPLLILEAMKMETRLVAEAAGTVVELRVADGDMVDGGQTLVVLAY
jgi:biotin carboxyl carrier protein